MAKRENESLLMKDLMGIFIQKNNLSKGMRKLKLEEVWSQLMGPGIANNTDSLQFQNQTLIIRLKSSALRHELSFGKEKIRIMINEEMGGEVVKKLMLV